MLEWVNQHDFMIGAMEAFVVAFGVVAFDCHNNVKAVLQQAMIPLPLVLASWIVWPVCGLFALFAFAYSATHPSESNWISQAISLGAPDNFSRGFTVGMSVLVLIRSKVMTAGNSEVGLEYFYNVGRAWILKSVNRKRVRIKNNFLDGHIDRMMAKANFQANLLTFAVEIVASESEAIRNSMRDQFEKTGARRPNTAFNAENPDWQQFYRDLAGIAVDYCGVKQVSDWVG
jgi:hypothetical protein